MTCCREKGKYVTSWERPFRPDYKKKPITEKFYSRYEQLDEQLKKFSKTSKNMEKYLAEIKEHLRFDRREHSIAPRTENQIYGWFEYWADVPKDDKDRHLMMHPKQADEMMNILRQVYACKNCLIKR